MKIFIAKPEVITLDTMEQMLTTLRDCLAEQGDMRACMHGLLPTFLTPEVVNRRVEEARKGKQASSDSLRPRPPPCIRRGWRRMQAAHEHWMRMALEEAELAAREGETPVGAVLTRENELLSRAHNRREQTQDPTAHAEMLALRKGPSALDGGGCMTAPCM